MNVWSTSGPDADVTMEVEEDGRVYITGADGYDPATFANVDDAIRSLRYMANALILHRRQS